MKKILSEQTKCTQCFIKCVSHFLKINRNSIIECMNKYDNLSAFNLQTLKLNSQVPKGFIQRFILWLLMVTFPSLLFLMCEFMPCVFASGFQILTVTKRCILLTLEIYKLHWYIVWQVRINMICNSHAYLEYKSRKIRSVVEKKTLWNLCKNMFLQLLLLKDSLYCV